MYLDPNFKMRTVMLLGFVLSALPAAGKVILSKTGQTAKFTCEINSANFRRLEWLHQGKRIFSVDGQSGMPRKVGNGEILKRSRVTETTLEVANVKKEDDGQFTCQMDGKTQQHTLIVVSVLVNPSGVLQQGSTAEVRCEVKSPTTVKWKRPDGSSTESGIVQLNPVEKSHGGEWECQVTHDSVTYKESLTIVVKEPDPVAAATTPTKNSAKVPSSACEDCDPNPPLLLGRPWWIWVAIGVGSMVVLLLLVVVIVLCQRVKRKKRKHHRRQNGHTPMKPRQFCQCNRPTAAQAKPQQGRRREKPVALPRQPLLME